jgi:gamma-glutamyltranspeptidase
LPLGCYKDAPVNLFIIGKRHTDHALLRRVYRLQETANLNIASKTIASKNIAFTAPHYAASQVGQNILLQGGTAIEAIVAAAASISVVYPHMSSLGGDGFWLISEPGKAPIGIDASGPAAHRADLNYYAGQNHIESHGPRACLNMAGVVAGWKKALDMSHSWQSALELDQLLSPAIGQAEWGIEVTQSLQNASEKTFDELHKLEHFEQFLIKGKSLRKGKILKLPKIAQTLQTLANNGLDDFYHGDIAKMLAEDLATVGAPMQLSDFETYQAQQVKPLSVNTSVGKLYNLPAPTQGIASLIILALFDKVQHQAKTEAEFIHLLVECTKQAFLVRDAVLTDPSHLAKPLEHYLQEENLNQLAKKVQLKKALPWPHIGKLGDTVWMAACDHEGRMVSYIQSIYWEFGSGIVSPQTGIVWNNRGSSFSLESGHINQLKPGLKPFHTLNPAFAELKDGTRLSYGTMGGEGQPQTQAAIFSRYVYRQQTLPQAIAESRWLLGRTWGDNSHNLKIEDDIPQEVIQELATKGHEVASVAACNELMGHAGAIVLRPDNSVAAATDPRSDGKAFAATL